MQRQAERARSPAQAVTFSSARWNEGLWAQARWLQLMLISLDRLRKRSGQGEHELEPGIDGGTQASRHLSGAFSQEVTVQRDELRHIGDGVLGQP